MCWADKIVFAALAVLFCFVTMIWAGSDDPHWVAQEAEIWPPLLFRFFLPIWIVLRLIDWLAGGPRRRRGGVTVYPIDR